MKSTIQASGSLLILCLFLIPGILFSQDYKDKIRYLDDKVSPAASIQDVSWIAGNWSGNALGGKVHENWSKAAGGTMMCAFRLVKDNAVQFYELVTIVEESESLMLRLKHFNSDLTGWEEKNDSVEFPLVELSDRVAYFNEFTMELVDKDHLNVYVVFEGGKESPQIGVFKYTRNRD